MHTKGTNELRRREDEAGGQGGQDSGRCRGTGRKTAGLIGMNIWHVSEEYVMASFEELGTL